MSNLEQKLSSIRIRPLLESERASAWAQISMKMANAPAVSPFSFAHFARGFATVALTLLMIVFGGRATDRAVPGDTLYTLDRSFERTFLSILPDGTHNRVLLSQAEERGDEIALLVAHEAPSIEQSSEIVADDSAMSAKMAPAPTADTMMMATFALDAPAPVTPTYSEETEKAINDARAYFADLEIVLIEKNDQEGLQKLWEVMATFETTVSGQ